MLKKSFLLSFAMFCTFGMMVGCGGNVEEGVADAPDEPEVEMTAEEEASEEEAARNAASQ
ncbi:MAG: hypothetical protein R3C18_09115 [Planctomycetaceae bacterium]